MTALIVGAAVGKGLLDIDRPLAAYGVAAAKGVDWGGWWPNVTVRARAAWGAHPDHKPHRISEW